MGWQGLDRIQHKDARRSSAPEPSHIPAKHKRTAKPWLVMRTWGPRTYCIGRFATRELAEVHRARRERAVAGFGGKARHFVLYKACGYS